MGKSILIITLGVSLIIGFIILKVNSNATQGVEATVNKFDKTHARLIANSGIEIYLEKLKNDMTMLDNSYPNNNLFNGSYDITINGPDSLVKIISKATFMGVTHTSIADARADRLPFHAGKSAMYLGASTIAGLKKHPINGNILIDGHDHNLTPPYDSIVGAPAVPGIGVDGEDQRLAVLDMIQKNKIDQIIGYGVNPSVHIVSDTIDWDVYASQLVTNPDIIITPSSPKHSTWGTLSDPKVTFINVGNSGAFTINNSDVSSGCGILVINGSINFNGNFTYTGLVISYKDANIDNGDLVLGGTGNVTIVGSLVGAGQKINLSINSGGFNILYSTAALSLISNLIQTKRFEILSWWE